MSQFNWDRYFIRLAELVSTKSKDRSMHVGSVLVGPDNEIRSTGFNGFCRGVDDNVEERYERPEKYMWTEHSERNSIYSAARIGTPTKGCTLYLNYEPYPCPDCARAVIQAGVTCVVGPNRPFVSPSSAGRANWAAGFERTKRMFSEAGIEMRIVELPEGEYVIAPEKV